MLFQSILRTACCFIIRNGGVSNFLECSVFVPSKRLPSTYVSPVAVQDQNAKDKALHSISSMSSAQIVSATAIHSKLLPGIVHASFPGNAQVRLTFPVNVQTCSKGQDD